MTYQEVLANQTIALSISESADLSVLGLAPEHLQDAMAEVARYLLASGARLIYGGDLRPEGFTEVLFELVARHRRDANEGDNRLGVDNILAWPVHINMHAEEMNRLSAALDGLANLVYLNMDGTVMPLEERKTVRPREASSDEWKRGLSTMRSRLIESSDARIILGGVTTGFKGRMPGVAEEALYSLQARQPLYLLAGFGGCTQDLAEILSLLPSTGHRSTSDAWQFKTEFEEFDANSLNNGLTLEENILLASTVHIDEAVLLILRGLLRLKH